MRHKWFLLLIAILYSNCIFAQQKPFPQHVRYFKGAIEPNQLSQIQLDKTVEQFYTQWKARYVKTEPGKQQNYYLVRG